MDNNNSTDSLIFNEDISNRKKRPFLVNQEEYPFKSNWYEKDGTSMHYIDEENNAFSPIVQTNKQTEKDIVNSGLEWVIGRNGIYIEPDLEYLETYIKEGEIRNCAGEGKCTYTSRKELGYAYAKMLLEEKHNGKTYNLIGNAITQSELVTYINQVYNTQLVFNSISFEDYATERKAELGDFMGTIIAGIYQGIEEGAYNVPSDFEKAADRPHKSPLEMIKVFKG